jgi:hypothetical protein
VERYTAIVARFLAWAGEPVSKVAADRAYHALAERGTALGLSASCFHA